MPPSVPPVAVTAANTTLNPCPAQDTLIAFNRGLLPPAQAEAICQHLESCPRCEANLTALRDDSDRLIAFLRLASQPGSSNTDPLCQRLQARAEALIGLPVGGADLTCPCQLGQYQLIRPMHSGGMGVVYEAFHTHLQRKIAFKTIRSDRVRHPQLLARFQREMVAIGKLDHPGIVRALDAGTIQGRHYLVMDFVEGRNLSELVHLRGPLPSADACAIVYQAALALQYVHENGLVHRDVKPSNLMLTPTGEVKLLDLGLALLIDPHQENDEVSQPGRGYGTVDYMAPEQALDSHNVDIRADIYSLGCTLYKLLTGSPPFSGPAYPSMAAKLLAHQHHLPPPLAQHRADLPVELQGIIDRMLAKDPRNRFADPAAVAAALQPFTSGCNLAALQGPTDKPSAGALESLTPLHSPETVDFGSQAGELPALTQPGSPTLMQPASPALTGPGERSGVNAPSLPALTQPRSRSWRWLAAGAAALVLLPLAFLAAPLLWPPPNGEPGFQPGVAKPWIPGEPGRAKGWDQNQPGLPWPDDYPLELIHRNVNQPIKLLTRRQDRGPESDTTGVRARPYWKVKPRDEEIYLPLWGRRLCGPGNFEPNSYNLDLFGTLLFKENLALIMALDDDLQRRWFEFTCDVVWYINEPPKGPRGIFFGWHSTGKDRAAAYFVYPEVQMDMNGKGLIGQVVMGPAEVNINEPVVAPLKPYQGQPPATVTLTQSLWTFRLQVRTEPNKITLKVNNEQPLQLRPAFDPRGPLGIWAQKTAGRFREASITALPVPSP